MRMFNQQNHEDQEINQIHQPKLNLELMWSHLKFTLNVRFGEVFIIVEGGGLAANGDIRSPVAL